MISKDRDRIRFVIRPVNSVSCLPQYCISPSMIISGNENERYVRKSGPALKPKTKLSTSMTWTQFECGYWYATEVKEFAKTIGIPSANKLRKDELEKAIKLFLETGKIKVPTKRSLVTPRTKDVERGLS